MAGTKSLETISTKLLRIAKLAREHPQWVFTTLAHHIDIELLREAHRLTRKSGAPGVDGQTAEAYAEHLEENLQSLLDRFKSGTYRAPPVRRVHIPKSDGKTRPLGIPTFEDKILQRAVAMVLGAIYEEDFLDCSHGFRPGRSQHQALEVLRDSLMQISGGVVLELDVKAFYDTLVPAHLRTFLDQRVRDGVIRRTIDKWLKAGVLEDGNITCPELGTPQGGVVSPLLSNIYLHEVLDKWFVQDVQPRLHAPAKLVRFADDAVIVFSSEADARRVETVLAKRFAKYGLTVHPEKTRLVAFHRPQKTTVATAPADDCASVKTFDFLGFTHYWGLSRKGYWVVKQKTAKTRLHRALGTFTKWCRKNCSQLKVRAQYQAIKLKLQGHYAYYGVTGNAPALGAYYRGVEEVWRKWLNRRSQKPSMPWERYKLLRRVYPLPQPRVVHSVYHSQQTLFDPKSRMREIRPSGSVGGPGRRNPRQIQAPTRPPKA
jgi:group II intron reverse transcriptase/maturase